jgi:hypothetical protein
VLEYRHEAGSDVSGGSSDAKAKGRKRLVVERKKLAIVIPNTRVS